MIRVQRTPTPPVLRKHSGKWLQAYLSATTREKRRAAQDRYRHPRVKKALVGLFHGKCASCESKITHVDCGHEAEGLLRLATKADGEYAAFARALVNTEPIPLKTRRGRMAVRPRPTSQRRQRGNPGLVLRRRGPSGSLHSAPGDPEAEPVYLPLSSRSLRVSRSEAFHPASAARRARFPAAQPALARVKVLRTAAAAEVKASINCMSREMFPSFSGCHCTPTTHQLGSFPSKASISPSGAKAAAR